MLLLKVQHMPMYCRLGFGLAFCKLYPRAWHAVLYLLFTISHLLGMLYIYVNKISVGTVFLTIGKSRGFSQPD